MSAGNRGSTIQIELVRVVRDLAGLAAAPAQEMDRDSARTIHETRVALKRLRAAARLIEPTLGPEALRRADGAFRDAGQLLAGRRDTDVLAITLRRIAKKMPKRDRAAIRQREAELLSSVTASSADWQAVMARVGEGVAAIEASIAASEGRVEVAPGLRATYRKARKLGKRALASGDPQDVHRWRRWIKHLLYQAQLVAAAARLPVLVKKRSQSLTQLGRVLGRHHDLALLREGSNRWTWEDPRMKVRLLTCITRLEAKLLRKAKKLGKRALGDRSSEFVAKVASRVSKTPGR